MVYVNNYFCPSRTNTELILKMLAVVMALNAKWALEPVALDEPGKKIEKKKE